VTGWEGGGISLQWGHGNGAVEEEVIAAGFSFSRFASMGPRQWSRGRVRRDEAPCRRPWRFNGATAMEPWKSEVNDNGDIVVSKLQWGHGNGAVEEKALPGTDLDRRSRFNGATAMEPWKSLELTPFPKKLSDASMGPRQWSRGRARRHQAQHGKPLYASMGPRQWSRGRVGQAPRDPQRPRASMGPRQWSRGRDNNAGCIASYTLSLQWGHGNGAVEE